MTGPEHYTEAEFHLNAAQEADDGSDAERYNLAAAQVHATLAQAAATISLCHDTTPHEGQLDADEWTPALTSNDA